MTDKFPAHIRQAAQLLSLGMDRTDVVEALENEGVDPAEAILMTIAAAKYLADREEENERLKDGWYKSATHPLDKPLPNRRKEKGKIE